MEWFNSIRALLAVTFGIGVHVALFTGNLSPDSYENLAMIVITAYFVKRSADK